MRFRLGLVIGFGSGYYLGSMAGRERFEQINRTVGRIKRSDVYEVATEKVHEAVDTGVSKAKDVVHSARANGHDVATEGSTGSDPYLPPSSPMP